MPICVLLCKTGSIIQVPRTEAETFITTPTELRADERECQKARPRVQKNAHTEPS